MNLYSDAETLLRVIKIYDRAKVSIRKILQSDASDVSKVERMPVVSPPEEPPHSRDRFGRRVSRDAEYENSFYAIRCALPCDALLSADHDVGQTILPL